MKLSVVRVTLHDADDQVLQEGDAVNDRGGRRGTYTPQPDQRGVMIKATAFDLARNTGSATLAIDGTMAGK